MGCKRRGAGYQLAHIYIYIYTEIYIYIYIYIERYIYIYMYKYVRGSFHPYELISLFFHKLNSDFCSGGLLS
jgi:hypothetical protein